MWNSCAGVFVIVENSYIIFSRGVDDKSYPQCKLCVQTVDYVHQTSRLCGEETQCAYVYTRLSVVYSFSCHHSSPTLIDIGGTREPRLSF